MRTDLPFPEARRAVLDAARLGAAEPVHLGDAVGRTLAGAVTARDDLPPFDTSAMDGWAVRLGDLGALPASLPLAGTVHAGQTPAAPLAPGTAVGVMTGAPLPADTEAVISAEVDVRAARETALNPYNDRLGDRRPDRYRLGDTVGV